MVDALLTPDHIRQIPIFKRASVASLESLCRVAKLVKLEGNQPIFLEGEKNAPVYFVLSGVVRVFKTNRDGREQTLIHIEDGAPLNLPTAFSEERTAPASAVAATDSILLYVPQNDFKRVILDHRELALVILQNLSERLRHLVDLTYDLSLRTVRGRLARFLLLEADESGQIPDHWTREDIAAQVGSVRAVVSRMLSSFAHEGLISFKGRHIVLADTSLIKQEARQ